jgi:hypothetical protein
MFSIEARLTEPETVDLTISVTMGIGSWRSIAEQLRQENGFTPYPVAELRREILSAIYDVERRYVKEIEASETAPAQAQGES